MTRFNGSVGLFLAAALCGCSSITVSYDYDPTAKLAAYRTYDWMPGPQEATGDRRIDNSLIDIRVRTIVDGQLAMKGYSKPASDQPDFYVTYHASLKDLMKLSAQTDYYGYGVGERSGGGWPGGNRTTTDVQTYKEASLILDVLDVATRRLVWRGIAEGEAKPGATPEEKQVRIRTAVHEMLKHFPPK
jgi:hypothetical protein